MIAAFQIYASAQDNAYSDIKQLRIRIVGRMLQFRRVEISAISKSLSVPAG